MRIKTITVALVALALLVPGSMSIAQSPSSKPQSIPKYVPGRVLVKFKPGTAASEIGKAHRQAKGQALQTIPGIGVQVVRVPAGTVPGRVAAYKANPNVQYAEPDYYRLLVVPDEDDGPTEAGGNLFDDQWYLNNTGQLHTINVGGVLLTTNGADDADIDAPEGWELSRGITTIYPTARNTPKIAVLDSGASCTELDLQSKCLEQVNVVKDYVDPFWDSGNGDALGHGTFVASEAAADTNNNIGIAGAAWNTSFGAFKVCYAEIDITFNIIGLCPVSASADAIMRASTDQFDTDGTLLRSQYDVITMSYGSDLIDFGTGVVMPTDPSNAECDAVQAAWDNGVVVVAAAGNNGNTNKTYPAACTHAATGQSTVIAVAASDDSDNRASFSTFSTNADDWVSLAAPGETIAGLLPYGHCGLSSPSDSCVDWWNGTSMAAPLVAGAAALVWAQLFPDGSPQSCTSSSGVPCNEVVRKHLEYGADTTGAAGQDLLDWTRHGRLNLHGALSIIDTDLDGLPDTVDTDDDDDGLSDSDEINIYETDPLNPDSDDDDLDDGAEIDVYGTNPMVEDTDLDGYTDGEEVAAGTNPLDGNSKPLPDGDINNDAQVDVADLLLAMRILNGQYTPTQEEQARWDVAPLVNGVPQRDQQNTLADYVVLQRKVLGIINF